MKVGLQVRTVWTVAQYTVTPLERSVYVAMRSML